MNRITANKGVNAMQRALRPYVTTGIAIVGASVIAAAPMQPVLPADVQIPNTAAQVERAVGLAANEIQTAVNDAIYAFVARPTVAGAELLGELLAPLIGEEQAFLLPLAALGFAGPLISGGGAIGTALQTVVDSEGLEELLVNLVGAPGTIIDGIVNGGYGPNLAPLVADQVAAVLSAQLSEILGMPVVIPPAAIGLVLAGGLLSAGELLNAFPPLNPPINFILPGAIPVLQGLVGQLFGLLGHSDMETVNSLLVAEPDRPIEDGVNELVFAATAATLHLVTLAAPLLEPILGDQAAAFLALGTVGLLGPLISGTGAVGTALQNVFSSEGLEDLVTNLIGAPGTVIDGVVNGGYGPNLQSLLPLPTAIPPGIPVTGVFAPGLIQNPGFTYLDAFEGVGFQIGGTPMAPTATLLPPGTIAVLQGLVERVFGAHSAEVESLNTPQAPAVDQLDLKIAGDDQGKITPTENLGGTSLEGQTAAEGPEVKPKKHRQRVELNVFKLNPLDQNNKKDGNDAAPAGSDGATTVKHRPGLGMTPVRDLVKRVLGGGDDNDDDGGADAGQANDQKAAS